MTHPFIENPFFLPEVVRERHRETMFCTCEYPLVSADDKLFCVTCELPLEVGA